MSSAGDVRGARHHVVVPANRDEIALSGHTVAGLIDAEASLIIAEMNGGATLSCGLTLAVRDDDVDLLHALARYTGIGVVRHKDQRGNPQACWSVYRKTDAGQLVTLLDAHPLRGRKRREFEVWREAVIAWLSTDPARFEHMRALKARLQRARAYCEPDPSVATPLDRVGFDDWLGGFVAGDGSFGIRGGTVRLTIRLRADDAPLLRGVMAATGAGKVSGPYDNPGSKPVVVWNVCSRSDLVAVVERLDGRVPGRKAGEFEVWQRAVAANADASLPRPERLEVVADAEREIKRLRTYRPLQMPLPSAETRRGNRMFHQNLRWVTLLREWASTQPGALSGTAYDRARGAGWPTRNTLARRFGSWYDALAAARLSDRAARSPAQRERTRAAAGEARERRRQVRREQVIDAMRRCAADLGRLPGPTEYARWRLHKDPHAPTFVTAYGLFPGGWSDIHAALA